VRRPGDAACGAERHVSRPGDAQEAVRSAPMTLERWRLVKAIVQAALARPAAARPTFVVEACGDDTALRAEVTDDILKKKRDWFHEHGDAEGNVACAMRYLQP